MRYARLDRDYLVATVRDITERKQAEAAHKKLQEQFAQAQKMESVGRLAGGVAHDFNNLLMGIMGYVELCRDEIEPDHPIWIDPSQVDQLLANLCVNAKDAIGGGGKIILETGTATIDADYCATREDATPGEYVWLAVSDDGCGMDPATLAQIFEPFFTTKGIGEGTGLGLATVYGIVKQNNGFIHAYSEPGQGTTFKIYLPPAPAAVAAKAVAPKPKAPRGHGETVLLVEDEKSLRVTCGLFLEALGYNVLKAETPGEALKTMAGHPGDIQLLLTDVVLPGMDGRQLAQRVRAAKPDIKVLFMSGYTADVIAQRGVLEENVAFIGKPFSRDDLAHRVREVLGT